MKIAQGPPVPQGLLSVVARILAKQGLFGVLRVMWNHAVYHLQDKWNFVYLEFPLDGNFVEFPKLEGLDSRIATVSDVVHLEAEFFGSSKWPDDYDRRYLPLIGSSGVWCFLGERDGKLVHYSWVFLDASSSPLAEVPFEVSRLKPGDVYIGPVFTDPSARGFVYPSVLSTIVGKLREHVDSKRILVLVAGDNRPAISFYKKMGFREIAGNTRGGALGFLWRFNRVFVY